MFLILFFFLLHHWEWGELHFESEAYSISLSFAIAAVSHSHSTPFWSLCPACYLINTEIWLMTCHFCHVILEYKPSSMDAVCIELINLSRCESLVPSFYSVHYLHGIPLASHPLSGSRHILFLANPSFFIELLLFDLISMTALLDQCDFFTFTVFSVKQSFLPFKTWFSLLFVNHSQFVHVIVHTLFHASRRGHPVYYL